MTPQLAPYRRFAILPAVHHTENEGRRRCVWFVDRRFGLPGLGSPFVYGSCLEREETEDMVARPARNRGPDSG